jgi:hypothetical protein
MHHRKTNVCELGKVTHIHLPLTDRPRIGKEIFSQVDSSLAWPQLETQTFSIVYVYGWQIIVALENYLPTEKVNNEHGGRKN